MGRRTPERAPPRDTDADQEDREEPPVDPAEPFIRWRTCSSASPNQ